MNPTDERITRDTDQTMDVAREMAARDPDCPCYYLEGELGAGKTVLAKGIAGFYGVEPSRVVSPTFALVNRYSGGHRLIYHLDLYRIEREEELAELGIEDMEEEGALILIEWPSRLGRYRREDATLVEIERIAQTNEDSLEDGSEARRIRIHRAGTR